MYPEDFSTDMSGLLDFLDGLTREHAELSTVRYVINDWYWGGVLPLKHHGFTFKVVGGCYFTLDFGRKGIEWGVFTELPEDPDGTCDVMTYGVNAEASVLRSYCKDTKPWSLMTGNDCSTWSEGMLRVMNAKARFISL